jgi:glutaredoxin 3
MKQVTVYSTDYCSFCTRAKALLAQRGIPFVEVDVTRDDARRAWLVETTGRRTVPQIFIGDEAIGGFTDLDALDRSGALAERLGS